MRKPILLIAIFVFFSVFINCLLPQDVYAEGSLQWIFPECLIAKAQGNATEEGQTISGSTYFSLINPNSTTATVQFSLYVEDGLYRPSAIISLLPHQPTVIDLSEVTLFGLLVNPRFYSVTINSTNSVGFFATKDVEWTNLRGSNDTDDPQGSHGTTGANALSNKWYFPVGYRKPMIGNGGGYCGTADIRAKDQQLELITKFVFFFDDDSGTNQVQFTYLKGNGTTVTETIPFAIKRGSYVIKQGHQITNSGFSTIVENVSTNTNKQMVVERVIYWQIKSLFYHEGTDQTDPGWEPLGAGTSEIGIINPSSKWYLPLIYQSALDWKFYVTVMNPNNQPVSITVKLIRPKNYVKDPADLCDFPLYLEECDSQNPGSYHYVCNPTTPPTIQIPANQRIRINWARLFLRKDVTTGQNVNDLAKYSACVYPAEEHIYVADHSGHSAVIEEVTTPTPLPIVVEKELFNNRAEQDFWYADWNQNGKKDYIDYCSMTQWETGEAYKGIPEAKPAWLIPFEIWKDGISTENYETAMPIANYTTNSADVRFYLLSESGKIIPFKDRSGNGMFTKEIIMPFWSISGAAFIGKHNPYDPVFPFNVGTNIAYVESRLNPMNPVNLGQPIKMKQERGFVVIESLNETPVNIVAEAVCDQDQNAYLPKHNGGQTPHHPDKLYDTNTSAFSNYGDNPALNLVASRSCQGYGIDAIPFDPDINNIPKERNYRILNVNQDNIELDIPNDRWGSQTFDLEIYDLGDMLNSYSDKPITHIRITDADFKKPHEDLSWLEIKTQSMTSAYTVKGDGHIAQSNLPWEAFSYDSNNPTTVTVTVHNYDYAEDQYEVALTLRARFDNDTGPNVDYKEVENSPILIRVMMNVWYIIPPC